MPETYREIAGRYKRWLDRDRVPTSTRAEEPVGVPIEDSPARMSRLAQSVADAVHRERDRG